MEDIPYHPACSLFPELEGEYFEKLKNDIKEKGLLEKITLIIDSATAKKMILDGRNRYRACKETRTRMAFEEYWDDDPIGFVISKNIHRRHLTASQRAAIATASKRLYAEEGKKKQVEAAKEGGKTGGRGRPKKDDSLVEKIPQGFSEDREDPSRDKAAKQFHVNPRYVDLAEKLEREALDLFEKVKSGEMTITQAARELKQRAPEIEDGLKVRLKAAVKNVNAIIKRFHQLEDDADDAFAELHDISEQATNEDEQTINEKSRDLRFALGNLGERLRSKGYGPADES